MLYIRGSISNMKRALILDLDNTIYPVSSIATDVFNQLFALIDEHAGHLSAGEKAGAKEELTRRPYHHVAAKFNFSNDLKNQGNNILKNFSYDKPMQAFDDYHYIKNLPHTKFLVTTGYSKLQWSKVKLLGIEPDFAEIHIVDPEISTLTKKDVFADILKRHHYTVDEVLVIGDDPESEINAATQLGIETFLFDPGNKHHSATVTHRSKNLKDVVLVL
jgi:putative hydrolase of the HAD superfamily